MLQQVGVTHVHAHSPCRGDAMSPSPSPQKTNRTQQQTLFPHLMNRHFRAPEGFRDPLLQARRPNSFTVIALRMQEKPYFTPNPTEIPASVFPKD